MRIVELKTKQSLFKFTSVCDGRRPCVVWTQEDVEPVYRKALTPFHQAAAPVAGINNGRPPPKSLQLKAVMSVPSDMWKTVQRVSDALSQEMHQGEMNL